MTVYNIALLLPVLALLGVHGQDTAGPVVVTDSGAVRGFVDFDRLSKCNFNISPW